MWLPPNGSRRRAPAPILRVVRWGPRESEEVAGAMRTWWPLVPTILFAVRPTDGPSPDQPSAAPRGPSAWSRRWPVLATAVAGFGIATYLALYQVGVLSHVWEPFFGSGSRDILKQSAIARDLPIPDAALGAAAYLAELVLELIGGED